MRRATTIFVLSILLFSFNTQAQSVYNNGFEQLNSNGTLSNWGNVYLMPFWIDSIGGSHTDSIIYDGQFYGPTYDAHNGTSALELRNAWDFTTNSGIAGAVGSDDDSIFSAWGISNLVPTYATPFSPFEPFNFGFYYKFSPVNGDTAYAQIALWDSSGNQLAEGIIIITDSANNYTLIHAPVNYTMTGLASFYSFTISTFYTAEYGSHQPGFGTRLLADDIGFNFVSPTGIEFLKNSNQVSVFPNPANEKVNIVSKLNSTTDFKIYNLFGQVMLEGNLFPGINSLSLSSFAKGTYIFETNIYDKTERTVFIKE